MEKLQKVYRVYKHISPSGKIYIGQTCQRLSKRFGKNGAGYSKSPHFYAAIVKYGWDNFQHDIIADNLTLQEANYLERYLILYYESYNQHKGYNITYGGENSFYNKPVWNKGKRLSEEHRMKLRSISINRKDISKQVLCVETNIIYVSAAEAERQTGINSGHISACRIGTRKTAGGFHWTFP